MNMAKRILIADDSVTIQKAFAMTFAGEDVIVTAARSVDEGLAQARQARPDLIVADGAMPGRTGYDLCSQVRADAALRGVPVYILASSQQPYDEGRGRGAGADGHFLKPWDTTALMEKVYAAAGAASAQPAAPARVTAASLPASAMEEEDYGEISIDSSGPSTPLPITTGAPAMAAAPRLTGAGMPVIGGPAGGVPASLRSSPPQGVPAMRPSLIPGMRPGAMMPPARPGTAPARPLAAPAAPAPSPSMPPRPAAPPVGRTMIGLPAAGVPLPGARPGAPLAPPMAPAMRSPTAPIAPLAPPPAAPVISFAPPPAAPAPRPRAMTPPMVTPPPRLRDRTPTPPPVYVPPPAPSSAAAASVSESVEQKLAAISAKGPEYAAIAKLSREIIEQVVWEVVPELAEAIIRERVEKQRLA
ncbi:MAG TPA: response regulator [Polyangia bacterium]|jgi:CheY-like chemotaxis protein